MKENGHVLIRDNKILFVVFEMENLKDEGGIIPLQGCGVQIVA